MAEDIQSERALSSEAADGVLHRRFQPQECDPPTKGRHCVEFIVQSAMNIPKDFAANTSFGGTTMQSMRLWSSDGFALNHKATVRIHLSLLYPFPSAKLVSHRNDTELIIMPRLTYDGRTSTRIEEVRLVGTGHR